MEQQIHTVHFKADKKLLDFIHDKINKLQLFNQAITSIEVFLILENDKEKQNKDHKKWNFIKSYRNFLIQHFFMVFFF